MFSYKNAVMATCAAFVLAACSAGNDTADKKHSETTKEKTAAFAAVSFDDLKNADKTPNVWLTYGGTYDEQRFSRLNKISTENVTELGVAWTYELSTNRGVERESRESKGITQRQVRSCFLIIFACACHSELKSR